MDKKIVLQNGVTFSYDNDGVVRDMRNYLMLKTKTATRSQKTA